MKIWSTRLLVLLVLFSAQSLSLAHEVTHVSDIDAGLMCEVCLVGQGIDSAIVASHEPSVAHVSLNFHVHKYIATQLKAEAATYTARAPPFEQR
ncbi:MAG: hypothetical protein OEU84_05310 [Xanthomonadales bacterium]|nr:hypothetical protein [Xanthomonadales bacterium]